MCCRCPFGWKNPPKCDEFNPSAEVIGVLAGSAGAVLLLAAIIGYTYYRRKNKNKGMAFYCPDESNLHSFISTIIGFKIR